MMNQEPVIQFPSDDEDDDAPIQPLIQPIPLIIEPVSDDEASPTTTDVSYPSEGSDHSADTVINATGDNPQIGGAVNVAVKRLSIHSVEFTRKQTVDAENVVYLSCKDSDNRKNERVESSLQTKFPTGSKQCYLFHLPHGDRNIPTAQGLAIPATDMRPVLCISRLGNEYCLSTELTLLQLSEAFSLEPANEAACRELAKIGLGEGVLVSTTVKLLPFDDAGPKLSIRMCYAVVALLTIGFAICKRN